MVRLDPVVVVGHFIRARFTVHCVYVRLVVCARRRFESERAAAAAAAARR